ncbi:MAG: 2-C-methyl-D-erythritol 2,4-cyclodiphosphate synthase [Candidatus Omnitrophica bacterium]|nr:2-C-methyl-D-erythritol 2,4-cyclodiphosphate synthase [Candidatus Omnitrophota bacterium]
MNYRVGIGYDIHRLVDGRKLFIGGVEIPYIQGLLGHSDADVLLHAICDALLGAIGEGDIGEHFPDTDPKYDGVSSKELLKTVYNLTRKKGYSIVNVDTIVIAQEPVLSPFKKQIQESIASILNIREGDVNIKAKTNDGFGEVGRKEAIAAYAMVTVISNEA